MKTHSICYKPRSTSYFSSPSFSWRWPTFCIKRASQKSSSHIKNDDESTTNPSEKFISRSRRQITIISREQLIALSGEFVHLGARVWPMRRPIRNSHFSTGAEEGRGERKVPRATTRWAAVLAVYFCLCLCAWTSRHISNRTGYNLESAALSLYSSSRYFSSEMRHVFRNIVIST